MKGLELGQTYFSECVDPILRTRFPGLLYSAARLGTGSDVLGFDDETSRDHDWGPKFHIYLVPDAGDDLRSAIDNALTDDLPRHFRGYATGYSLHDDGTADFDPDATDTRHALTITTVAEHFQEYLGVTLETPLPPSHWLALSPQKLRTIISGRVFHDGLGSLNPIRETLAWYPQDIWLYLMANQWKKIDQEEPFVGRTGDVGDELGSRIVATRQIVELMTLAFLIERQYPPYFKWFGTAFSRLESSGELSPIFDEVLNSRDWKSREHHLSQAYLILGCMHNALELTSFVEPTISPFHTRPYLVPHSGRFVEALQGTIESEAVRSLPRHLGAVWQFADSTDILSRAHRCRTLANIYED
jgi:hypothetical protein